MEILHVCIHKKTNDGRWMHCGCGDWIVKKRELFGWCQLDKNPNVSEEIYKELEKRIWKGWNAGKYDLSVFTHNQTYHIFICSERD